MAATLIGRWLARVVELGSPGCHLQTLVENTRAVHFFERSGFAPYREALRVPGVRYRARPVHQQAMVWTAR